MPCYTLAHVIEYANLCRGIVVTHVVVYTNLQKKIICFAAYAIRVVIHTESCHCNFTDSFCNLLILGMYRVISQQLCCQPPQFFSWSYFIFA